MHKIHNSADNYTVQSKVLLMTKEEGRTSSWNREIIPRTNLKSIKPGVGEVEQVVKRLSALLALA